MNVSERIIDFDYWLFFKMNGTWTNHFLDAVFPFLRESVIWIPLYLFLLVFILTNFGLHGVYWAIAFICTVSLCDIISSHLIKETFMRLRPCRNPDIASQVNFLVKYCPMNSSFVSSHAANHFGMALFVFSTLRGYAPYWAGLFFVWAAIIGYAQVYVGVHFPSDVICGALVGCLIGILGSRLFNKYVTMVANP
ncbi:MAG: phosphatase PAP2 family protein [Chitinophagaceae bacterium]